MKRMRCLFRQKQHIQNLSIDASIISYGRIGSKRTGIHCLKNLRKFVCITGRKPEGYISSNSFQPAA